MKKLLLILLTITFLLQSGMSSFIVMHFAVLRKEITKAYCKNLTKPELKCRGKCFLDRALKEQRELEHHLAAFEYKKASLFFNQNGFVNYCFQTPLIIELRLPEFSVKDFFSFNPTILQPPD